MICTNNRILSDSFLNIHVHRVIGTKRKNFKTLTLNLQCNNYKYIHVHVYYFLPAH